MDKPKGGRGQTAPYDTKQMRVPVGLEEQIQELIARYRQWISEAASGTAGANTPPRLLDKTEAKPVDNFIALELEAQIQQIHGFYSKKTFRLGKLVDNFRTRTLRANKLVDKLKAELEQSEAGRNSFLDSAQQWQDIAEHSQDFLDRCEVERGSLNLEVVNLTEQLEQLRSQLAEGELVTSESNSSQVLPDSLTPVSGQQLAKRLGRANSTIIRHKAKPDFSTWSRGEDPDKVAWRYDAGTKEFFRCLPS